MHAGLALLIDCRPKTSRHSMAADWMYSALGSELVSHVFRPRRRPRLPQFERTLLFDSLVRLGHEANEGGAHYLALAFFESAYNLSAASSAFISATNMRLRLGQFALAMAIYDRLLQLPVAEGETDAVGREEGALERQCSDGGDGPSRLSAAQRDHVSRKRAEAASEASKRARGGPRLAAARDLQDELGQLLTAGQCCGGWLRGPERAEDESLATLLGLMRRLAHAANSVPDIDAARLWFDCAYALSSHPSDLLSAANMRLKAAPSDEAERLYDHLLSVGELSEADRRLVGRKLELLAEAKRGLLEEAERVVSSDGGSAWLEPRPVSTTVDE